MFYFQIFCHNSSSPCYYYCSVFYVFSDLIVSFVLYLFGLKFLSIKTLYIVNLSNREVPHFPTLSSSSLLSPNKSSTLFPTLSKSLCCIVSSCIFILCCTVLSSSLYCVITVSPSSAMCLSSLHWVPLIVWYSHIIVICVYLIWIMISHVMHSYAYYGLHLSTPHLHRKVFETK